MSQLTPSDDLLELDPDDIADPADRTLLVFFQWHYDSEAEPDDPARKAWEYATGLVERLDHHGLAVVPATNPEETVT